MAACCGIPLLLGTGIAVGAIGIVLGSGALVAVGAALAFWSRRRRRVASRCRRSVSGSQPIETSDRRRDPADIVAHDRSRTP
jgi:hypothetical protein